MLLMYYGIGGICIQVYRRGFISKSIMCTQVKWNDKKKDPSLVKDNVIYTNNDRELDKRKDNEPMIAISFNPDPGL